MAVGLLPIFTGKIKNLGVLVSVIILDAKIACNLEPKLRWEYFKFGLGNFKGTINPL